MGLVIVGSIHSPRQTRPPSQGLSQPEDASQDLQFFWLLLVRGEVKLRGGVIGLPVLYVHSDTRLGIQYGCPSSTNTYSHLYLLSPFQPPTSLPRPKFSSSCMLTQRGAAVISNQALEISCLILICFPSFACPLAYLITSRRAGWPGTYCRLVVSRQSSYNVAPGATPSFCLADDPSKGAGVIGSGASPLVLFFFLSVLLSFRDKVVLSDFCPHPCILFTGDSCLAFLPI